MKKIILIFSILLVSIVTFGQNNRVVAKEVKTDVIVPYLTSSTIFSDYVRHSDTTGIGVTTDSIFFYSKSGDFNIKKATAGQPTWTNFEMSKNGISGRIALRTKSWYLLLDETGTNPFTFIGKTQFNNTLSTTDTLKTDKITSYSAGSINIQDDVIIDSSLTVTGTTVLNATDSTGKLYGRIVPRWSSEVSSATPTINTDKYDCYSITALATAITSMTTNISGTPLNFQKLLIRIKDDGTARAITWGASFASGIVTLPATTVLGKTLTTLLIYNSVSGKWVCQASGSEQ